MLKKSRDSRGKLKRHRSSPSKSRSSRDSEKKAHHERSEEKISGNEGGRTSRIKRAWKCRLEEESVHGLCQCTYVSRRTQLACKNFRPKAALSKEGFCEVHTRFFRQLQQLYRAEQCRSDQGLFLMNRTDEDGVVEVSDVDETLSSSLEWPRVQQDLYNNVGVESDEYNPLKNAEVITEEEVLVMKIEALERQLSLIRKLREVLAERAKRKEAMYRKKLADEARRGVIVAQTRKEKRMLRTLRALKKRDRGPPKKLLIAMKRLKEQEKVGQMVEEKEEGQTSEQFFSPKCSYIFEEEVECEEPCEKKEEDVSTSSETTEGVENMAEMKTMKKRIVTSPCTNPPLPKSTFCIQHVLEDPNQMLFAACLECGARAYDYGDGEDYCFEHGSLRTWQIRDATPIDTYEYESESSGSAMNGEECQEAVFGQEPLQKLGESCAKEVKMSPRKTLELRTNAEPFYEGEDEGNAFPMKYVVIDSGGDEDSESESGDYLNLMRLPVASPPPTAGVASHSVAAQDSDNRGERSGKKVQSTATAGSGRPRAQTTRKRARDREKEKLSSSSARTRPFSRASFEEAETKKRKVSIVQPSQGQRYITIEKRGSVEEGIVSGASLETSRAGPGATGSSSPAPSIVQSIVQRLRSGGPAKVAQMPSTQTPRPVLPPAAPSPGPRRVSISVNSNFTKPMNIIRPSSTVYNPLTDPSTISLGPASGSSQIPSRPTGTTYPSHSMISSGTNPPLVTIRTRSRAPAVLSRQQSAEAARIPYPALGGATRITSNWRSRTPIIVSNPPLSSNQQNYRSGIPNEFADRSYVQHRGYSDYYRRRVEAQSLPSASGSARSRLVAVDSSAQPQFSRSSYLPYQGMSSSFSRANRSVNRPREVRRIRSSVELPGTSSAQDSREAAAAVASIESILEEGRKSPDEVQERIPSLGESTTTTATVQTLSIPGEAVVMRSEKVQTAPEVVVLDSPEKADELAVFSEHGYGYSSQSSSATNPNIGFGLSQPACDVRVEVRIAGRACPLPQSGVDEQQEDGLEVLAMAAASHSAARDCATTEKAQSAEGESGFAVGCGKPLLPLSGPDGSTAAVLSSISLVAEGPKYVSRLGVELEDDDS